MVENRDVGILFIDIGIILIGYVKRLPTFEIKKNGT